MVQKTISTRVPKKIEEELELVGKVEKVDRSTAVRKILEIGLKKWKIERALDLLKKEKITFNKAAELAGISVWELADLLKERKIEWVEA